MLYLFLLILNFNIMSEKQKLAEIEQLKGNLVTKMNLSKLKGGLASSVLIRGCCTQGCCEAPKRTL